MSEQTDFSTKLYQLLDQIESFLLLALLAGVAFYYFGISLGAEVVTLALAGLGAVFFLMAYRPPKKTESPTTEKLGFMTLLVHTIIPKILWIGCAVGAIGLLLRHLQTGNNGYQQLLIIQSTVTLFTLIALGIAATQGVTGFRNLLPIYFRALPIALAGASLLME